ncbi:hypothetical protein ACLB2K_076138 [Fragaria x ananassa]
MRVKGGLRNTKAVQDGSRRVKAAQGRPRPVKAGRGGSRQPMAGLGGLRRIGLTGRVSINPPDPDLDLAIKDLTGNGSVRIQNFYYGSGSRSRSIRSRSGPFTGLQPMAGQSGFRQAKAGQVTPRRVKAG